MSALPTWGTGPAESRIRRVLVALIGVSVTSNLLTDVGTYREQWGEFAPWWSSPFLGGQILFALALLVVPWLGRPRLLRLVALAFGVFGLVGIALTIPAAGVGGFPDDLGAAVPLRVESTYALTMMIVLGSRLGWIYVAVLAAVGATVHWLLPETRDLRGVLESTVVNVSTTVLLSIVVLILVHTGRRLDTAAEDALAAVRRDAAARARAIERRRVELIAHDEILHVLRVVAMGLGSESSTPQRLAAGALTRLEELDAGDEADLPGEEFLRRIRAVVVGIAPDADFEAEDLSGLTVPAGAARALLEAGGEALRNSVIHAAPPRTPVRRRVSVERADRTLTVSVVDDGRGFRAREVPAHRLGVARSIVARMRLVPGGRATLDSSPGAGTRVELSWRG